MPLYEFTCETCGLDFEARVAPEGRPSCPACGAGDTHRIYSAFAGPFTIRPRGSAARRVESERRVREEQRAQRREQRKTGSNS